LRSFVSKASVLVVMVLLCVSVPLVNAGVVLEWESPTTVDLRNVLW